MTESATGVSFEHVSPAAIDAIPAPRRVSRSCRASGIKTGAALEIKVANEWMDAIQAGA